MKSLTILFCFFLSLGLNAQITLTQANVPASGDTLSFARDTMPAGISIGESGANQIWDFSQLQADESFQLIATDAALDTESVNYPGANLVISSQQVKTFVESSDTAVYILGGSVPEAAAFGLGAVPFKKPQKVFEFPSTFGTSFTTSYEIDATVDGAFLSAGLDSVRAIRRSMSAVEIDAFGTVKTPFNSYAALRQKTETINYDSIYVLFLGNWTALLADTSQNLQYQWLTAETKGDAVSVNIDVASGLISSVEYFLDVENAIAPVAAFSFEDQGSGTFAFTDQSINAPTNWQWNFGDGNTSSDQNPVYTFSAAGDYQVCLTVSNAIGSNQSCQTIMVDLVSSNREPSIPIPLKVYPNPADQQVFIRPEGLPYSNFEIRLYNGLGQRISQRQFTGQLQLELSELPAGLYSYSIVTLDRKRRSTGKLVVRH